MAKKMDINVLGIVQNMSYVSCPGCEEKIRLFDSENTDDFFKDMDIKLLGEMPMIPGISHISTKGYEDSSKEIDVIFKPILENIMKSLK